MTGIAITILTKNPNSSKRGSIFYHDIGDSLSSAEKIDRIKGFSGIGKMSEGKLWVELNPNKHNDWVNKRDESFENQTILGDKNSSKKNQLVLFSVHSNGVVSNRDAWVYSFSKEKMASNCKNMIYFYNCEVDRYKAYLEGNVDEKIDVQAFVEKDTKKISWGGGNWQASFSKFQKEKFEPKSISTSLYRPFSKNWHYTAKNFNHSFYSIRQILPNSTVENLIICVSGVGARSGFSVLMTNTAPNLHTLDTGQCFPLYLYEPTAQATPADDLFSRSDDGLDSPKAPLFTRRDAITDDGLAHFADYYAAQANGEPISKEDLFYYIYGLLHSEDYRSRYADNLSKELPRIPRVKTYADFKHFSDAGRQLAHYHLNYESVEAYPVSLNTNLDQLTDADFYVTKMKFGKGKGDDRHDKTTVIYNHKITLSGIPLEAYDYVVNGKPALDWVIERQQVKPDKDSGIVNDANDWAIETMHNPRYPLELFRRVITVSLETLKIVHGLPPLDIE